MKEIINISVAFITPLYPILGCTEQKLKITLSKIKIKWKKIACGTTTNLDK